MTRDRRQLKDSREYFLRGIGVPEASTFSPDPFQLDAIRSLEEGNDTLVIAPTGAGKTYIAIEAIRNTVQKGKRAIYTAPLKALSNAKYAELKKLFEPQYRVGLLTGDRKIEANAHIVVATTEIYRNDLYSYSENYSLVVLDELHYLADPQRGAVWEESIVLSPRSSELLMLSASISNPEEIAEWIHEVRNKKVSVVQVHERPVELRLGFLHPELGVLPLEDRLGKLFPEVHAFYNNGGDQKRNFRRGRQSEEGRGPRKKSRKGRGKRQ